MADTSKAQKLKLANSRKRFKELQELKKKKNQNVEDLQKVIKNPTPIDSMTSSSHSSINNEISEYIENMSHLPNAGNTSNEGSQPPAALFFDNFVQKEYSYRDFPAEDAANSMSNYFNTITQGNLEDMTSNVTDNSVTSFQNVSEIQDQENYSLFPEDSVNNYLGEKQLIHERDNPLDFQMNQENESDNFAPNADIIRKSESEDTSESEITGTSNRTQLEIQHSNVESLKQLSNQMAELIEPQFCPNSTNYDHSITDLEKRNLELATMLDQEKVKTEKSTILINDLQSKNIYLENLLKEKTETSNFQSNREINKLEEELQSHLQTIGMLVAEKTELSVSLNKFETCSKQKAAECEELQARLKASRSRVAELEKEVSSLKLEKCQNENILQDNNALINTLKQDYQILKEQKDELVQDVLETREKLKNSLEENLKLQQLNQELNSKFALASIKLQQITNNDRQQTESGLDKITEEKFQLEKQVADLNQLLKTMTTERDDSVLQYQQYAQQQNIQLSNLTKNLEQLQLENENLTLQEQNRIKHISELEKQLQNLQIEQVALATDKPTNDSDSKINLENVRELCVQLQMEKIALEENYTKVSNEKDMLLKELEAKNDSLSQLEGLVEQLQGNQPDSVKLLATMESDKIAAARAVQQNKELKQHIESLEEVFLKLNNDKVELTEQVNREIRNNKELLQKLQKTEIHLQRLAEAVEIKDRELLDLRQDMIKFKKQLLQNEQVNDLLRHYEVQDNSSHTLQNELKEAKETIEKLTNEINILKHCLNEHGNNGVIESRHDSDLDKEKPEFVNNENINIQSIADLNGKNNDLQIKEISNDNETLDREIAIKYLEDKFKRTMQDIVELKEEKQSLEHLVLQLQGETETIGEYVALYHHQRMILKQRALEKDQQLKQITNDREYLKTKLQNLDSLIRKLVNKNTAAKPPSPQSDINDQLGISEYEHPSEKHSEMHEEISKIDEEIVIQSNDQTSKIADKIIDLLAEIKSSNLVQPKENVHHCAWCSGQLITV
ncbi:golgin subfamily A member 2 [Anoplophora glabripennis]|uniref:golgin subfamily A member 2 n=1 Tax=Anoplophora glabripennis TaxID=217634 RepID=UPI00087484A7|nr:golgin subfamily A member 2 [Anoplophora glabripennis]